MSEDTWDDFSQSKYLTALKVRDVYGDRLKATIEAITVTDMREKNGAAVVRKPVATLRAHSGPPCDPWPINKTNGKILQRLLGSPRLSDAIGADILVSTEIVSTPSGPQLGARIKNARRGRGVAKPPSPAPQAPAPQVQQWRDDEPPPAQHSDFGGRDDLDDEIPF